MIREGEIPDFSKDTAGELTGGSDPSPTPPLLGEGLSCSPFPCREGGWGVRFSEESQRYPPRSRGSDPLASDNSNRIAIGSSRTQNLPHFPHIFWQFHVHRLLNENCRYRNVRRCLHRVGEQRTIAAILHFQVCRKIGKAAFF